MFRGVDVSMTDWLVDFSFQRPLPEDVKEAGYVGGISYLSRSPEKNWDGVYVDGSRQRPGEVGAWLDAGMQVGMVWETTADRATQGYAAGFTDAQTANAEADALGAPATAAIYYAVDLNIGFGTVSEYFRGVLAAGGRPAGAYGSQSVVEGFLAAGGRYGWQVATWGFRSPQAHLFQEPNVPAGVAGTDANSCQQTDWGGWSASVPPGPPSQPALTGWQEIDRYLAQQGVSINVPPEDWQTTGGTHAATSWHYQGMARDYSAGMGCDEAAVVEALRPFAVEGGPIIELFHAATNTWWPSNVGGHTDHAHVAIAPGASLPVVTPKPPEEELTTEEHNALLFCGQFLQEIKNVITEGGDGDQGEGQRRLVKAIKAAGKTGKSK